uniref:Uncharacterized protein n=1 Tax=Pithovirus LCDPAC02 TaxID=2506601 RepID=A0A481YQY3_9VIRU|nr:MAG: hypothetical protein LCDPAC02_00730 [Pithovirus LCDPAC02]
MLDLLAIKIPQFVNNDILKELLLLNKSFNKIITKNIEIKALQFFDKINFDLDFISVCTEI